MPVAVMKAVLSVNEFNGWVDYFQNKPPDVQEIQMAILMNMVAQGLGSKKSKVDDFIISKKVQPKPTTSVMSANEVKSIFSGLAQQG